MEKRDMKYRPHPDYRYWLYNPEGDGMTYYRTKEDRDKAGAEAVAAYLDDGWTEEVEYVAAGEVTHSAQCLNKKQRPDDIDEEGCDGEGTYWGDFTWIGNYALEPMVPNAELSGASDG